MFPLRQTTPHALKLVLISLLLLFANRTFAVEAQQPPAQSILGTNSLSDQQIAEGWGWMVAQEKDLVGIELNDAELSLFLKGVIGNLTNAPTPINLRDAFPNLQRLAHQRRANHLRKVTARNEAAAEQFFSALKKNTNVFALPNGLYYETLKTGDGTFPKPEQTVNIHYFGHLLDGTEFAEFGPLDHLLVTNHTVCRGWVDALQKLDRGGKMRLYVPPPLSETEAVSIGLRPGLARVYDIELFEIKNTSAEELASATSPAPPETEPPFGEGFTDAQLIQGWGWSIAQQIGAAKFNLSQKQINAFVKGLIAGIREDAPPADWPRLAPAVNQFVANSKQRVRRAELQKRHDEANHFFAALKANTNIVQLPNGLRYEIVKPGSGTFPKPEEIVVVNYTGRLVDGTVFDRTDNEPLNIQVGSVTPGWNEGIQKINKGGRLKLYIPSELGFGDVNVSSVISSIPGGSALIYDIELLDIKKSLPGD